MMPMLSVTNPNLAAAYQIGQALQKHTSPQAVHSGLVAAQGLANSLNGSDGGGIGGFAGNTGAALLGQTPGGGLDSMGSLLAALSQPAAGNPLAGAPDANPFLAALAQSGGADTDTNPLLAALAQTVTTNTEYSNVADPNAFLAGLTSPELGNPYTSGTDPSAFLAALSQPNVGTPFGGSTDPDAFITSRMQAGSANPSNQDANQALPASFIQQQSNAAAANLLASLGATQGTPFQATAPGGSPAQDTQAQFIASLLQKVQGQAQATSCADNSNTYTPAASSQPFSSAPPNPTTSQTESNQTSYTATSNTTPESAAIQDIPQPSEQQTPASASSYMPSPNFASRPPNAQSTSVPSSPPPEPTQAGPAWVHHQDLTFGLDDILLPAHHNLRSAGPPNFLVGDLHLPNAPPARLEIKLLYTAAQARHDALALQALAAASSDGIHVLEPSGAVAFGGVVGIACAVCTHNVVVAQQQHHHHADALYRAVAQSPHGHGLAVSVLFVGGAPQLPAVRALAVAVLASVRWADRARVCRAVAARLLGRWENGGEGTGEAAKRLVFAADGRYAYDKGEGAAGVEEQSASYDPDHTRGQFEVYEYGGGLTHLVLAEDFTGGVEVQEVEFGEGFMTVKGKKFVQIQG
jgi:hypothetical protein